MDDSATYRDLATQKPDLKEQMQLTPGEQREILNYIRGDYHMNEIPTWLADLIMYGDRAMMNVEHLNILLADKEAEVKRLREALRDIAHGPVGYWNKPQHREKVIGHFMKIATEALHDPL